MRADPADAADAQPGDGEDWLEMSRAVRREAAELVGQFPAEVPRRQDEVDQLAAGMLDLDVRARAERPFECPERVRKRLPRRGKRAESTCCCVAAALREVGRTRLERR